MAVKWLQSAVYPPSQPRLQTGLTPAEVDADYRRLEAALRRMEVPRAADEKGPQNYGRDEKGVRPKAR